MKPIPFFGRGKKTDCDEAERLIQDSLDGQLTSRDRALLDSHLRTCASCRVAWDEYRGLSRSASQWVSKAAQDPGDAFTQRVMAEIADLNGAAPRHRTIPARRAVLAGLAATSLVFVVAACLLPSVGQFVPALSSHWSLAVWITGGHALDVPHSAPTLPTPNDFGGYVTQAWVEAWRSVNEAISRSADSAMVGGRGSMWSLIVFLTALAANIVLAGGMARRRGRAL